MMSEGNFMEPEQVEVKKGFNPLYLVAGLAGLGIIGYFVVSGNKKTSPTTQTGSQITETITTGTSEASPSGSVKEFTVDGSSYKFDPETITVSKGDTVKITFRDNDGMHDLVVDDYNVKTNVLGPGKQDSITFVVDKAGSFKYYCSVSNHEDLGMTGTLVVQ
jgi:plastocyanin